MLLKMGRHFLLFYANLTIAKECSMKSLIKALFCLAPMAACATGISVDMAGVTESGVASSMGTVLIEDSPFGGVLITPNLKGLAAGVHGFHVHEMSSCAPADKDGHKMAAGAAGGHFDPAKTGVHAGPYGNGHLGDLPILVVDADGATTHPILAPRIKLSDFSGHALMVHAGGDNYAGTPDPVGGGGARLACGVIAAPK
jgi:Cu-Zn family superoxide dismutase